MITVTAKANNSGNKNIKLMIPLWCLNVGKKYNPTKKATQPAIINVPLTPQKSVSVIAIYNPAIIMATPTIIHPKEKIFRLAENSPITNLLSLLPNSYNN